MGSGKQNLQINAIKLGTESTATFLLKEDLMQESTHGGYKVKKFSPIVIPEQAKNVVFP